MVREGGLGEENDVTEKNFLRCPKIKWRFPVLCLWALLKALLSSRRCVYTVC